MAEFHISDLEIQETERLLLPTGCHFDEDAIRVIRRWESTDVSACPGSGKTTVLLAKLKLLADRMPLDNGAGICVLSHTNVAVNEIKGKLSQYAGKIMSYPNYVGTIQSFIDKFVVQPYIRRKVGRTVQPLDDRTYAKHMLHKIRHLSRYETLKGTVEINYATLYLETERNRSSDIVRMLYYYGVVKSKPSALHDYSRKIVYVGMSRPRKLLCVAIRDTTYERGKNAFLNWSKVFLQGNE